MKGKLHSYSCDTKDRHLVHIYLILISIAFAYLIRAIFNLIDIQFPWWIGLPGIFTIYGALYHGFRTIFWKWDIIRFVFFIKTPNINGIYSGVIRSSFDNFQSEKNADIVIQQFWDKALIELKTDTSYSYSKSCSITIIDKPTPTISYIYQNEPKSGSVETMVIHYGMCMFEVNNNKIDGEFFTGRGRVTHGTIEALKKQL